MKVTKLDKCDKARIPLAQGDVNGRQFSVCIFTDGTGCILEFNDGAKYLIETIDIVNEILNEVKREDK